MKKIRSVLTKKPFVSNVFFMDKIANLALFFLGILFALHVFCVDKINDNINNISL